MTTLFKQVVDAAASAIGSLPERAELGGRVFRDLDRALAAEEQPAIAIEPGDDDTQTHGVDDRDRAVLRMQMRVRVHVITRASPPIDAADPIEQAMHTRLMADPSLGGLLTTRLLRVSATRRTAGQGDAAVAVRTVTYQAIGLVLEADLTPAT